jgi:hypothetical protein
MKYLQLFHLLLEMLEVARGGSGLVSRQNRSSRALQKVTFLLVGTCRRELVREHPCSSSSCSLEEHQHRNASERRRGCEIDVLRRTFPSFTFDKDTLVTAGSTSITWRLLCTVAACLSGRDKRCVSLLAKETFAQSFPSTRSPSRFPDMGS